MKHKTVGINIVERKQNGGEIIISTGALDRDKDHVNPLGAKIENYLKNPVVQWGHNYSEPWATIGKTTHLEVDNEGLVAQFELREPVNESDPQNVILQLWNEGWIKSASIGFNPNMATVKENEHGGMDFGEWDLLEWSLVPIPANQEALRLAVKGLDKQVVKQPDPEPEPEPEPDLTDLIETLKSIKEMYTND